MDPEKRRRLEDAGWIVGDVEQLLGVAPEELSGDERQLLTDYLAFCEEPQGEPQHMTLAEDLATIDEETE